MEGLSSNFCFPIHPIENDRLRLEPFDVSEHAQPLVEGVKDHPELFEFLPYGPFDTISEFEKFYNPQFRPSSTECLFAILSKCSQTNGRPSFAGVVGLLNASPDHAVVEVGFITILPPFQRSFVTSNAVGLLVMYTLDPPPDGLGLRRCQWQAHAANEASRKVALRMGFTFEGVQRFQRIVPSNKRGNGYDVSSLPRVGGRKLGPSRDSAVYAHYCDEWPEKRKEVKRVLDRR